MKLLITTSSFDLNLIPKDFKTILNPYKRKLTEGELIELIKEHNPDALIAGVEPITKEVLSIAKNLKVISRCGIAMESIDLEDAKRRGIIVTNTPDAPTPAVAELTVGIILDIYRKITISSTSIKKGEWVRPMGNFLRGKTVGLIGCGRIGKYVANILSAFGCEIIGYDTYFIENEIIKKETFDNILRKSDIISLHLPLTNETTNIIGVDELSKMKKSAILINVSRGGLIDEGALYDALKLGKIAGAGLDCFVEEPYTGKLIELDNVVLTAHIGSYAKEGRIIQEEQSVKNLIASIGE